MMVKTLSLKGQEITNVLSVRYELPERSRGGGYPGGERIAMSIIIKRNAEINPTVSGFGLVANGDGSKNIFDGKIELTNLEGSTTYELVIGKAFVSHWSLKKGQDQMEPAIETLVLNAGDVTLHCGAGSSDLIVSRFK